MMTEGGKNIRDFIKRVMNRIMSVEVQQNVSRTGSSKKEVLHKKIEDSIISKPTLILMNNELFFHG